MQPNCPAATPTHGTLSHNAQDVRCNITGLMRDAAGSPCYGDYAGADGPPCAIWRGEKQRLWEHKHAARAAQMQTAEGAWL